MVCCIWLKSTLVSTDQHTYNALPVEPLLVVVIIRHWAGTFPEQFEFGGCLLFAATAWQVFHQHVLLFYNVKH